MKSVDLKNILNKGLFPVKFMGDVTTVNAAANADKVYYFKPSFACRLINATLHVVTAPGASTTLVIRKITAVENPTPAPDQIVVNSSYDGDAVSNSDLITLASGTSNEVIIPGKPDAHYSSANNAFYPDNDDALLITFSDTNHDTLMVGELELEFLPL